MARPLPRRLSRVCGLGLLLAGSLAAAARGETLVLGMSADFRGPSRGLSIELYRGSMAYFEHVNRAGGVQGRTIAIKALDDRYNPIPAIENTVRLIKRDDVFLLFDYMGSATVARILPLLKEYSNRSIY